MIVKERKIVFWLIPDFGFNIWQPNQNLVGINWTVIMNNWEVAYIHVKHNPSACACPWILLRRRNDNNKKGEMDSYCSVWSLSLS